MKTLLIAAALTLASSAALAEEALVSQKLLDGKVTMLIPASFTPMEAADIVKKYPGRNAPKLVLTNADTDVNVALGFSAMLIKPEELKNLEAPMRQQFGEPNVNASGIRFLNGHQFLLFNFDVQAADGKLRNVMAMTSYEGKLLLITYNCPVHKDATCDQLGSKLIGSIKMTPER